MIDENWYRRPPDVAAHTAAGGVIVRREGKRLLIALIRESDLQGFVLPKGHVEPGESLEAAARREIREESGLHQLTLLGDVGVRERLDHARKGWKRTHYFLFIIDRSSEAKSEASGSSSRVHWFPLEALPEMFWPEQRELVETSRDRIAELVRRWGDNAPQDAADARP